MKKNKIEQIFRVVCRYYGIKREELSSACRKAKLVEARAMTIVMMRAVPCSYPIIGSYLHRDHATIMYNYKTMKWRIANEIEMNTKYRAIRKEIQCLN